MARSVTGNRGAFLDMIAWSEGTPKVEGSDDGYNVIVGETLFDSYDDHPRKLVILNKKGLKSTAAGRYQLLARYFDHYREILDLDNKDKYPDGPFSPPAQDVIAIQQIKECRGALADIDAGSIESAIKGVSNIWASLPGNNYDQHQNSIEALLGVYKGAGGNVKR